MSPSLFGAIVLAIAASGAPGQVINPGFEDGSLDPWQVTPTPHGNTQSTALGWWDIDGPGPLPASFALQLGVGQVSPNTGYQGVSITQPVSLGAGEAYHVSVRWSVSVFGPASPVTGGRFELLLNNAVVASADAPVVTGVGSTYGTVEGDVSAPQDACVFGVRITRPAMRTEPVQQFVDDLTLTPAAPACIGDFNGSGGVPDDADVAAFFVAWNNGDELADVNASGGVPDDADVGYFFVRWNEGC